VFGEQLTTIAALHRRLSPWKMLLHWFITFWGNLAGSLFVMAIIFGYGGGFSHQARLASNIPTRHRGQLAGLSGRVPVIHGQGVLEQSRRHLVPHLRICVRWLRSCSVLHLTFLLKNSWADLRN
jgi:hypothetical protein